MDAATKKRWRVYYEGIKCSHEHPSKKDAEKCRDSWLAHLRKNLPKWPSGKKCVYRKSDFVFKPVVPFEKEPIWCARCKKYIPRVRWHGHYDRNHGINSPEKRPHKSHRMTKWRTEVRCPGSTPRFYGVRECKKCGLEELNHAAGHFNTGLREPCGKYKGERPVYG